MNLSAWTSGDEAAQEAEGFRDGQLDASYGHGCPDGMGVGENGKDDPDATPYARGYMRGWRSTGRD